MGLLAGCFQPAIFVSGPVGYAAWLWGAGSANQNLPMLCLMNFMMRFMNA
jgi:hypothetical protein